jgi:hypothetical protein
MESYGDLDLLSWSGISKISESVSRKSLSRCSSNRDSVKSLEIIRVQCISRCSSSRDEIPAVKADSGRDEIPVSAADYFTMTRRAEKPARQGPAIHWPMGDPKGLPVARPEGDVDEFNLTFANLNVTRSSDSGGNDLMNPFFLFSSTNVAEAALPASASTPCLEQTVFHRERTAMPESASTPCLGAQPKAARPWGLRRLVSGVRSLFARLFTRRAQGGGVSPAAGRAFPCFNLKQDPAADAPDLVAELLPGRDALHRLEEGDGSDHDFWRMDVAHHPASSAGSSNETQSTTPRMVHNLGPAHIQNITQEFTLAAASFARADPDVDWLFKESGYRFRNACCKVQHLPQASDMMVSMSKKTVHGCCLNLAHMAAQPSCRPRALEVYQALSPWRQEFLHPKVLEVLHGAGLTSFDNFLEDKCENQNATNWFYIGHG